MVDDSPVNLNRLAVDAALNSDWTKARKVNQQLLKEEPENVDCLLRLAKACFELGRYLQAKKIYQQALEIDPYNSIAQKNVKKLATFKKNGHSLQNGHSRISPTFFLEEPGKTKLVTLIKVAEPNKLMMISAGLEVKMQLKNRGISVTDQEDQYLGVLPDDTAHHLRKLLKGGNKYQAFIKSVKVNSISILIREIFRSKKFRNQASFLDGARVLTFSSDNISLSSDNETETLEQLESEESS